MCAHVHMSVSIYGCVCAWLYVCMLVCVCVCVCACIFVLVSVIYACVHKHIHTCTYYLIALFDSYTKHYCYGTCHSSDWININDNRAKLNIPEFGKSFNTNTAQ